MVGDLKGAAVRGLRGRLQIYNAVGGCTVRQIDGDRLPPGHQLYVDQATKQVVLTWPWPRPVPRQSPTLGSRRPDRLGHRRGLGDRNGESAHRAVGRWVQQQPRRVSHFQHVLV